MSVFLQISRFIVPVQKNCIIILQNEKETLNLQKKTGNFFADQEDLDEYAKIIEKRNLPVPEYSKSADLAQAYIMLELHKQRNARQIVMPGISSFRLL